MSGSHSPTPFLLLDDWGSACAALRPPLLVGGHDGHDPMATIALVSVK